MKPFDIAAAQGLLCSMLADLETGLADGTYDDASQLETLRELTAWKPATIPEDKRVTFVCTACGSDDVLSDAYAEWDSESGGWVVQNTFDKGAYCNHCDGECSIEEIPLADYVEPEETASE